MYCPHCANPIADDATFCPYCGQAAISAPPIPAPPTTFAEETVVSYGSEGSVSEEEKVDSSQAYEAAPLILEQHDSSQETPSSLTVEDRFSAPELEGLFTVAVLVGFGGGLLLGPAWGFGLAFASAVGLRWYQRTHPGSSMPPELRRVAWIPLLAVDTIAGGVAHANKAQQAFQTNIRSSDIAAKPSVPAISPYAPLLPSSKRPDIQTTAGKASVGFAILVIAAFFMPWVGLFGFSLSGFEIAKMDDSALAVFLVPIMSFFVVIATISGSGRRLVALISGVLPFGVIIYAIVKVMSEIGGHFDPSDFFEAASEILKVGAYLTLIGSAGLIFSSISGQEAARKPSYQ